jgi:hypothetical protein
MIRVEGLPKVQSFDLGDWVTVDGSTGIHTVMATDPLTVWPRFRDDGSIIETGTPVRRYENPRMMRAILAAFNAAEGYSGDLASFIATCDPAVILAKLDTE